MRLPLREKIQNAINRVLSDDGHVYNDYNNNDGLDGALKVGGRRRNRKKKKNKKNGQKKKKSPSLESIKAKLSPPRSRIGSNSSRKEEDDHTPLISDEEDFLKDDIDDIRVSDYYLANAELYNHYVLFGNHPMNTMPLFGRKKKEEPKEVEAPEPVEETPAGDAPAEKPVELAEEAKEETKEPVPAEEPVSAEEKPADQAKVPDETPTEPAPDEKPSDKPEDDAESSTQTQPVTVTYNNDSDGVTSDEGKVALQGMTTVKSEKSPLITKNGSDSGPEVNGSGLKDGSPLKDMQPGIVCPCTIL